MAQDTSTPTTQEEKPSPDLASQKSGETEEILEILHTQLEKEENGDLFYCLARVYKFIGQLEEYYQNLSLAIKNPYTLTFPLTILKQELDIVEDKLGKKEEIEPENIVEEYESFDSSSEIEEDFEDDSEEDYSYDESEDDYDNSEEEDYSKTDYEFENDDFEEETYEEDDEEDIEEYND